MFKINQTRKKFKELFVDVEKNAGDIIELQLDCIEKRMEQLENEGRDRDLVALGQEYLEWVVAVNGDRYGFLFINQISREDFTDK